MKFTIADCTDCPEFIMTEEGNKPFCKKLGDYLDINPECIEHRKIEV